MFSHITIASVGRTTLFAGTADVRSAIRAIARTVGSDLLLFGVVDDHVHLPVLGTRAKAGRIAQSVSLALRPIARAPLAAAHIQPVESRHHLRTLVDYVLTQPIHHNLAVHAARWEGSCLPDLIGARLVPGLSLGAAVELPRLRQRELLAAVGLPPMPLLAPEFDQVRRTGMAHLLAAVSRAFCLPRPLGATRQPEAQSAFVSVACQAGFPLRELQHHSGLSRTTVWRARRAKVSEAAMRAVLLQLALDDLPGR